MSHRLCVFCGENPVSKTREHIIPQWLLEFTGDPKRQFCFGIENNKIKQWSANNYVMPACQGCNNVFSSLESAAKPIVISLLKGGDLIAQQYSVLMDWLDKVRVGLWLAFNVLDRVNIPPKFHISQRIGKKDRMLLVYFFPNLERYKKDGVNFEGVKSPLFKIMPSCFSLRINGTLIINASYDFLISARIGFPFPRKTELDEATRGYAITHEDAFHKIKLPLIRHSIISPSIQLYQPILLDGMLGNKHEYVQNYINSKDSLKGKIFEQIGENLFPRNANDIISFQIVNESKSIGFGRIVGQVYDLQNYLINGFNIFGSPDNEITKACLKWNRRHKNALIKHYG